MDEKQMGLVLGGSIKAASSEAENVKQSNQQGEIAGFNPATLPLRSEYVSVA